MLYISDDPAGPWAPYGYTLRAGDPVIDIVDGVYTMLYKAHGTDGKVHIALAVSHDGKHWKNSESHNRRKTPARLLPAHRRDNTRHTRPNSHRASEEIRSRRLRLSPTPRGIPHSLRQTHAQNTSQHRVETPLTLRAQRLPHTRLLHTNTRPGSQQAPPPRRSTRPSLHGETRLENTGRPLATLRDTTP